MEGQGVYSTVCPEDVHQLELPFLLGVLVYLLVYFELDFKRGKISASKLSKLQGSINGLVYKFLEYLRALCASYPPVVLSPCANFVASAFWKST